MLSIYPYEVAVPEIVVARRLPARRILVVDDNEDAAESLALFLCLTGHEVRTVLDGAQAIRLAREFRPEAVILDIGLPGMDGFELARLFRQDADLAGVVLVALTGYGDDGHRQRSLESGCDWHLVKPADPLEVQAILAGRSREG
jgi:DNA-binding response OmpR family regulator